MPAPQPTADDLRQVLDRLTRILNLVLKLIAMRPQDQQDIQGILTANRGSLDLDWVRRQWWAVVDEDDPTKLQFERFVREFYDA